MACAWQPRKYAKSIYSLRQQSQSSENEMSPDLQHKEMLRLKKEVARLLAEKAKKEAEELAEKEKKEKEKDLEMQCYICHERMCCPLRVCSNSHHACARCLRKSVVGTTYAKGYVNYIPVITGGKTDISKLTCGPCGQPMQPTFPGTLLMKFVDPTCRTTCEFCKVEFPLNEIGMHILQCPSNEVAECPWCKEKHEDINKHFLETCNAIGCELCQTRGMQLMFTYRQQQVHVNAHQMGGRMKEQIHSMLNNLVDQNMALGGIYNFIMLCTLFLTLAESRSNNPLFISTLRTELKTVEDEYKALLLFDENIDQDKGNHLFLQLNDIYEQTAKILVSVEEEFANEEPDEPDDYDSVYEAEEVKDDAAEEDDSAAGPAESKFIDTKCHSEHVTSEPAPAPQDPQDPDPEYLPSEPDFPSSDSRYDYYDYHELCAKTT